MGTDSSKSPKNEKLQEQFAILNLRYVKTKLCYDADILHIARLQQKQKIDSVISNGLQ